MTFDELLRIKRAIERYKRTLKAVAKVSKKTADILQVVIEDNKRTTYLEPKNKDNVYTSLLDIIRDYGDSSFSTCFVVLWDILFKAVKDIKGDIRISLMIDNIQDHINLDIGFIHITYDLKEDSKC